MKLIEEHFLSDKSEAQVHPASKKEKAESSYMRSNTLVVSLASCATLGKGINSSYLLH